MLFYKSSMFLLLSITFLKKQGIEKSSIVMETQETGQTKDENVQCNLIL